MHCTLIFPAAPPVPEIRVQPLPAHVFLHPPHNSASIRKDVWEKRRTWSCWILGCGCMG